jgi:hypothetical protein
VVLLNRIGLTTYQAAHERPGWEVRALLMNLIAEAKQRRREADGDSAFTDEPLNPPDTPAPAWVDELDSDEQ